MKWSSECQRQKIWWISGIMSKLSEILQLYLYKSGLLVHDWMWERYRSLRLTENKHLIKTPWSDIDKKCANPIRGIHSVEYYKPGFRESLLYSYLISALSDSCIHHHMYSCGVQTVSSLANRWQLDLYDALVTVSAEVGRAPDRSRGYGKNQLSVSVSCGRLASMRS